MYEIRLDTDLNRVVVILTGGYDHDQDAFHADLKSAIFEVRDASGSFDLLIDMVGIPVTPRDRVDKVERLIAWCIQNGLRYSAFALGSTTQQMQFNRISGRSEKLRFFPNFAEGQTWLNGSRQAA